MWNGGHSETKQISACFDRVSLKIPMQGLPVFVHAPAHLSAWQNDPFQYTPYPAWISVLIVNCRRCNFSSAVGNWSLVEQLLMRLHPRHKSKVKYGNSLRRQVNDFFQRCRKWFYRLQWQTINEIYIDALDAKFACPIEKLAAITTSGWLMRFTAFSQTPSSKSCTPRLTRFAPPCDKWFVYVWNVEFSRIDLDTDFGIIGKCESIPNKFRKFIDFFRCKRAPECRRPTPSERLFCWYWWKDALWSISFFMGTRYSDIFSRFFVIIVVQPQK